MQLLYEMFPEHNVEALTRQVEELLLCLARFSFKNLVMQISQISQQMHGYL